MSDVIMSAYRRMLRANRGGIIGGDRKPFIAGKFSRRRE